MVDLVRAGRNPDDLAREFEPSGHSIRAWVAQADRNEGRREEAAPGLTAFERDELTRLRRENKQLRLERDILLRSMRWYRTVAVQGHDIKIESGAVAHRGFGPS
jgi:transposase